MFDTIKHRMAGAATRFGIFLGAASRVELAKADLTPLPAPPATAREKPVTVAPAVTPAAPQAAQPAPAQDREGQQPAPQSLDLVNQLRAAQRTIADLQVRNQVLQGQVAEQGRLANHVIAMQGISLDDIPSTVMQGGVVTGKRETPAQTYRRLLQENPLKAGQFYQDNAEAILKSKPEIEQ